MQGKGKTTLTWVLSGVLAFSLFGAAGMGYAEPTASATDGGATRAEARADALHGGEMPVLEPVDSPEPAASEAVDGSNAPDDGNAPGEQAPKFEASGEVASGEQAPGEDNAVGAPDSGAAPAEGEESANAAMLLSIVAPANEVLATGSASYAQPGPGDFEFSSSSGTIASLSPTYIASLSAEQKKDIRITIPSEIDGFPVVAIGTSAFSTAKYTNSGLIFTNLDLSQATNLQVVGEQAFMGASSLSGKLEIPASVAKISKSAFKGTNFSGELVIPEGVQELWQSAFSGCKGITSVTIPSTLDFKSSSTTGQHFQDCSNLEQVTFVEGSQVTELQNQVFGNCAKLSVVELPDSVLRIAGNIFFGCSGLKTVYMPENADFSRSPSSFLSSAGSAVAVCKNKASYDRLMSQYKNSKLTYVVSVAFDSQGLGLTPPSVERLYGKPFNRVKNPNTKIWAVDSSYAFPDLGVTVDGGYGIGWSYDLSGWPLVKESSNVPAEAKLYATRVISAPTLVFGESIDKTYDGNDAYLEIVSAWHPLAKAPSEANVGDYVLYYEWLRYDQRTDTQTQCVQEGFESRYTVRDVADSAWGFGIGSGYDQYYQVRTTLLEKTETGYEVVPHSDYLADHEYVAIIRPAESTVNVFISSDGESNIDGFPALALSDGDTPGSVTWDAGQTLEEGIHSYTWTFTPEPPAAGKPANYTSASGALELRVVNGQPVQRVSFDTAGGPALDPIDVPCATALPTAAVPTRDGFVFLGWYQDAAYTQPWGMADPIVEDMTLFARWESRAATVDPGEGGVVVNGEPVDPGSHTVDIVHETEIAPEDEEALKNVELPAGAAPSAFFELKLVVDGVEVEKAEFNRALPVTVDYPVREGVRYQVAHLKHDGTVELLEAVPDVVTQSLTFMVGSLSPFMVLEQLLYQVTFDSAGGSAVAPLIDVPSGAKVSAPPTPTREGFAFVGWFKDAAGTAAWDFARDTVASDMTLYAVWRAAGEEGPKGPGGGPGFSGAAPDTKKNGDPSDGGISAVDDRNAGGSHSDRAARGSFGSLVSTGDPAASLPLLAFAAGVAALAFAVRRARRRMR